MFAMTDEQVFENLKDLLRTEAKVMAKGAMDGYRMDPDERVPPPNYSRTLISRIIAEPTMKAKAIDFFDTQYRIFVGEEWEKLKAEVMVGYEEWLKETL